MPTTVWRHEVVPPGVMHVGAPRHQMPGEIVDHEFVQVLVGLIAADDEGVDRPTVGDRDRVVRCSRVKGPPHFRSDPSLPFFVGRKAQLRKTNAKGLARPVRYRLRL